MDEGWMREGRGGGRTKKKITYGIRQPPQGMSSRSSLGLPQKSFYSLERGDHEFRESYGGRINRKIIREHVVDLGDYVFLGKKLKIERREIENRKSENRKLEKRKIEKSENRKKRWRQNKSGAGSREIKKN
jgi:hypothetical protein